MIEKVKARSVDYIKANFKPEVLSIGLEVFLTKVRQSFAKKMLKVN